MSYYPDPPPVAPDMAVLVEYLERELFRIAASLDAGGVRSIEFLSAPPSRLYEGLTVGADGTNWNPGSGKGVYTYYSGSWNKLG